MRFGEATALQVADLALDAHPPTIRINKAWKQDGNREPYVGAPKSARSRRTVSLSPDLADMLRDLTAGRKPDDLVFVNVAGRPIRNNTFWATHWQPAIDRDQHVQVEATWQVYQAMVAAYRDPDRKTGRHRMQTLITSLSTGVPAVLVELRRLGRTLKQRAADVLAYFERLGTSNGPTEAINGRLEHLRGTALGFRNLNNYIARCLLEAGGFRPQLHPGLR